MKIPNMIILRIWLASLSLMVGTGMAQEDKLSQLYCSNENTGSEYTPENSIYMSNGRCFDYCSANYAFAVVQYMNCWCSDYIPYDQQSTGSCNQKCPGFPGDLCGNSGSGLFGYVPLSKAPSGTAGAPSSAPPTSSSPPQSTPQPVTSYTPTPSSYPVSSDPISSSSSPSSSSPSPSPTPTATPKTTVQIITKSGSAVTQTVTQTPIIIGNGGDPSSQPDQMQIQKHPLSTGAVAGIVVGSLIGFAAILLAAFLLWRRRKYQDAEAATGTPPTRRPRRNISVLSKTGLLSRNRPESMAETNHDDNFYGTGSTSVRNSMMFGAGATVEAVDPASPLGGSQDNISSRRHSKPMVYDQRLNPSALFANADGNGSRVSIQDQNDYSRPLGVANPDFFRASFDSRVSR